MLRYLAPHARKPDRVALFTREGCQYCVEAKALLTNAGYHFEEVMLSHRNRSRVIGAITGEGTVPQVFVNGEHIGGADALRHWLGARKAA